MIVCSNFDGKNQFLAREGATLVLKIIRPVRRETLTRLKNMSIPYKKFLTFYIPKSKKEEAIQLALEANSSPLTDEEIDKLCEKSSYWRKQLKKREADEIGAYLRKHDILRIYSISSSTFDNLRKTDSFPKPFRVSKKILLWKKDDIDRWLESQS